MGGKTGIEWTEATWNPWVGCTKVSPGCAHCYMFREMERYGQDPRTLRRTRDKTFLSPLAWKEPRVIFTCSWSDFFHEDADAWRLAAWRVIRESPQHTYQILTKRPERIPAHLPEDWAGGYPNVWLGVSAENQRMTDLRVPVLVSIPAAVRWLSCEPLIGPVDLDGWLETDSEVGDGIDWVIAGGESGPKYRSMDLDWARQLRDQCQRAGVPFFLKQLGGWPNKHGGENAVLDGRTWTEIPARARRPVAG